MNVLHGARGRAILALGGTAAAGVRAGVFKGMPEAVVSAGPSRTLCSPRDVTEDRGAVRLDRPKRNRMLR